MDCLAQLHMHHKYASVVTDDNHVRISRQVNG
jgi:hypothetical protein